MSERLREGGCDCGHVRFRTRGEPIFINNCHCRQCQRQTGSTSAVNAFFESERIEITKGDVSEHQLVAGSGGPHINVRCSKCGVSIWSYYSRLARLGAGVRVSTFDDAHELTPIAVVYASEKLPWVTLPEGIPAFDIWYDYAEFLPPENFARLRALVKRREAGEGDW